MISAIRETGGHENIIGISDHGWLKGSLNVYFIDMELANFTLADYMRHLRDNSSSSLNIETTRPLSPVFVQGDYSFTEKMQNMWTIGVHIAQGLEFMHSHKHVHRDLKPSNGAGFVFHILILLSER